MIVKLSQDTINEAKFYARQRNYGKAVRGISGRIPAHTHELDIHLLGLLGEYAVSIVLGIDIDRNVYDRHGDSGIDLRLSNGKTISVKTRRKPGWSFALIGTDPREFNADYGFLCWPVRHENVTYADHIFLAGWCTKAEFLAHSRIENYSNDVVKYPDRLALPPAYFHPIETFEYLKTE